MTRHLLSGRLRRLWLKLSPRSFIRFADPNTAELGQAGEELAGRHLRRLDYRLLGRRLRTPCAEIDILASTPDSRWIVEVKTGRASTHWRPGDSLRPPQIRRLLRAAQVLSRQTQQAHSLLLAEVIIARNRRSHRILLTPILSARPPRWGSTG
ncbi:MAG: Holliday junction resolvase-like predicted endonuclease [Candidatus Paceibacteria bacterium]|jgi:Holliday junction resolvase-like predicted endonuclease